MSSSMSPTSIEASGAFSFDVPHINFGSGELAIDIHAYQS